LTSFGRDVAEGLRARPKRLSCVYFYDEEGASLFEQICSLDEYYLTRAEREILLAHAADIAELYPQGALVAELGSGNAEKTRVLLAAMLQRGSVRYLPIDVSEEMLALTAESLAREFPSLAVEPVAGDYEAGLNRLSRYRGFPRLVLWLGSSIGNLHRAQAAAFLAGVRRKLAPGDRLLVGIDLRKSAAVLELAYDDALGVTARFNLNLLTRISKELGADFDLSAFRHVARYNQPEGRVEMYLESTRTQVVHIRALNLEIHFRAGERIHTENSYKYSRQEIRGLARGAGLRIVSQWFDAQKRFSLNLFEPR
jgi:L-histidine N-alpha-methyltransferase